MAERETGDYRLELSDNQMTALTDEIGGLKELEKAACGWKSCNTGRNEKRYEIQNEIASHTHKTGYG